MAAEGQYKKLLAILDTTKDRRHPMRAEVLLGKDFGLEEDGAALYLVVVSERDDGPLRVWASSPVVDGFDVAAEDVARQMTLNRDLPRGMD